MNGEQPSSLDAACISVHETFMAYVRAGFSRAEALELVKAHIATTRPGGSDE